MFLLDGFLFFGYVVLGRLFNFVGRRSGDVVRGV